MEQGLKEKKLIEANLDRVDKLKPIAKVTSFIAACFVTMPIQLFACRCTFNERDEGV